jgi:DNA-binding response OmpR family regulator
MVQFDGLTRSDVAILEVLVTNMGRILSRTSLLQSAGLETMSERRCDASLVTLRRVLGPESIITVRRRGWMLSENALVTAMTLLAAVADKL